MHHEGQRQAQTLQLSPVLIHLARLHLPPPAAEQVDVQRRPPRRLHVPAHHQAVWAGGAEEEPCEVETVAVRQEGEGAAVPGQLVAPALAVSAEAVDLGWWSGLSCGRTQ